MTSARSKRWTFTLHNYTVEDEDRFARLFSDGDITHICYGKEVCPTTGTPHLQGYFELVGRRTLAGTKKVVGKRVSLRISKGTAAENKFYAKKEDDNIVCLGEPMAQGERNDLKSLMQDLKNGMPLSEVRDKYPTQYLIYGRRIKEVHAEYRMKDVTAKYKLDDFGWEPLSLDKSVILWGEPGIGKSQYALAHFKSPLWVTSMDSLGLFDPEKHDGIVFDDMNFNKDSHERQIAIVDHEDDRRIAIRYTDAFIPGGTRKIFTTNVEQGRVLDLEDGAVARRLTVVHLEGCFGRA